MFNYVFYFNIIKYIFFFIPSHEYLVSYVSKSHKKFTIVPTCIIMNSFGQSDMVLLEVGVGNVFQINLKQSCIIEIMHYRILINKSLPCVGFYLCVKLGSYILGYTLGNLVLLQHASRAVKHFRM